MFCKYPHGYVLVWLIFILQKVNKVAKNISHAFKARYQSGVLVGMTTILFCTVSGSVVGTKENILDF